ncbi:MAG TPA: DUF924 family protein [Gammaproteobacteria bacterium]|jgi:uncharacterized protein (DUF924 family)|nr:DUF924 family protein [Gammaproteobacteria bacterium]
MPDKIHELLNFWFGDLGSADLPTSDRTNLWFGESDTIKKQLLEKFNQEYAYAIAGGLDAWAESPRGRLALIILLDQFSRSLYNQSAAAFSYDDLAQTLCLQGIEAHMDHALTLVERVFFYMPLVHSENAATQEKSIQLYQSLVALSMTETTQVYQLFLAYAYAHFRVIKEFGRFPQRNILLGRESTEAELLFLKSH